MFFEGLILNGLLLATGPEFFRDPNFCVLDNQTNILKIENVDLAGKCFWFGLPNFWSNEVEVKIATFPTGFMDSGSHIIGFAKATHRAGDVSYITKKSYTLIYNGRNSVNQTQRNTQSLKVNGKVLVLKTRHLYDHR